MDKNPRRAVDFIFPLLCSTILRLRLFVNPNIPTTIFFTLEDVNKIHIRHILKRPVEIMSNYVLDDGFGMPMVS